MLTRHKHKYLSALHFVSDRTQVTAHEIGHNLGLPHASLWRSTDGLPLSTGGSSNEYGDIYGT